MESRIYLFRGEEDNDVLGFLVDVKKLFIEQLFQVQEDKVVARCNVRTAWAMVKKCPTKILAVGSGVRRYVVM